METTTRAESRKLLELRLEKIVADLGVQPRAMPNEETAQEYADALADGEELTGPRGTDYPVAFHGDGTYWLADGFTRRRAHELAGRRTMIVEVRAGDRRAAMLFAVSANLAHGLRLKLADKRRAARLLLTDAEWRASFSDREIGRRCGLSPSTIGALWADVQAEVAAAAASVQFGQSEEADPDADGEPVTVGGEQFAVKLAQIGTTWRRLAKLLRGLGPEGERALAAVQKAYRLLEEDTQGEPPPVARAAAA